MKKLVVVIEDEWSIGLQLAEFFEAAGWDTKVFASGDAAHMGHHLLNPALLVTGINMPGPTNGLDVARRYREVFRNCP